MINFTNSPQTQRSLRREAEKQLLKRGQVMEMFG